MTTTQLLYCIIAAHTTSKCLNIQFFQNRLQIENNLLSQSTIQQIQYQAIHCYQLKISFYQHWILVTYWILAMYIIIRSSLQNLCYQDVTDHMKNKSSCSDLITWSVTCFTVTPISFHCHQCNWLHQTRQRSEHSKNIKQSFQCVFVYDLTLR